MSKSIKDIINTYKTRQDDSAISEIKEAAESTVIEITTPPQVKEMVVIEEKPAVAATPKSPKIKKEKVEKKATDLRSTITDETTTENAQSQRLSLSDIFFSSLDGQEFSYEQRRIAYIETELYEIFMSLKRKKNLKNISVLINAILNDFIDNNKDDIKRILTNTRL